MTLVTLFYLLVTFGIIGGLFNYISVFVGLVALATTVTILFISFRKIYGLALLLFAISLSPEIRVGARPVRIEDFIVVILSVLWILDTIRTRKPVKPTQMTPPLTLFLVWMTIATFNGFIFEYGIPQVAATFYVLKHVEYVVIFFLVLNIVEDRSDVRFLVYTGLLASALVAIQSSPLTPDFYTLAGMEVKSGSRVSGVPTETANVFGGYLMFHLILAISFLIEEDRTPQILFFLFVIACIFQPLVLTKSRASYVGTSAGLFTLLILTRNWKLFAGITIIPILVISLFPADILRRSYSIYLAMFDPSLTPSWEARVEAWTIYFPRMIRHPFLGQGYLSAPLSFVDNEYLMRGATTGVIGLLSFFWVFIRLGRKAFYLYRFPKNILERQLGLGYFAALLSMGVHAIAITSFTTIRTAEPVYFFAGLTIATLLIHFNVGPGDARDEIYMQQRSSTVQRQDRRPALR